MVGAHSSGMEHVVGVGLAGHCCCAWGVLLQQRGQSSCRDPAGPCCSSGQSGCRDPTGPCWADLARVRRPEMQRQRG
eukprot:scaffold293251_cov19-Tisochrysis_lutea.AAC.2